MDFIVPVFSSCCWPILETKRHHHARFLHGFFPQEKETAEPDTQLKATTALSKLCESLKALIHQPFDHHPMHKFVARCDT